MRRLVLPISPGLPGIISATFIILIFAACAIGAQQTTMLPALGLRAQSGPESSSGQKPQKKKKGLAPVRNEEAPEGSRVTITYNEPLSDYSAYRQGDRFVVVIPQADAPRVRQNMRGRGFDGMQVEKRGDDTILSFRIQPGARARVDQQFNKLEVVFSAPNPAASNPAQTSSQAPASNTAQSKPATVNTPQTPLNNHNSTADNADQQPNAKTGASATVEANANAAHEVTTADSSLKPSNDNTATQPRRALDATTQPTPAAVSPSTEAASPGTTLTRYWLPLLIAALLLLSAYAVIAARRRTEHGKAPERDKAPENAPAVTGEVEPIPLEAPGDQVNGAHRSTELEESKPMPVPETVEVVAAPSKPVEALVGAAAVAAHTPAHVFKEPAPSEQDGPRIPGTTLKYLGSEDANERAAGVLNLADLGNDDAYSRIGAAFDDPVQQVRDAAARALFNINEDRAASFKRIMRASSPERRRRIGAAIASSGMAGEAISDLSSQSGERAFDALLVLSLMAKAGEVQSLIETIEDHPSTDVRLALVKLLALSGQPDILKTFRYLATRDSLPIAVRSAIMEAIYQLNNP
ncbi:MAG TPA: hypothetical protein VIW80_22125 [Pyrinomonadaceae bacterium]